MVLDYKIIENTSSFELNKRIIDLAKKGYELHGDLVVLISGGAEIYYQVMILVDCSV